MKVIHKVGGTIPWWQWKDPETVGESMCSQMVAVAHLNHNTQQTPIEPEVYLVCTLQCIAFILQLLLEILRHSFDMQY